MQKHHKSCNHVNKKFKESERVQGIFDKDRENSRGSKGCGDGAENETCENQVNDDELLQCDDSPTSIGNAFMEPINRENEKKLKVRERNALYIIMHFASMRTQSNPSFYLPHK